jgi:hypothetical protein
VLSQPRVRFHFGIDHFNAGTPFIITVGSRYPYGSGGAPLSISVLLDNRKELSTIRRS